jgi:hypothetical protein
MGPPASSSASSLPPLTRCEYRVPAGLHPQCWMGTQNKGQTRATDRWPVRVSMIQRRYKNHWKQGGPMIYQWGRMTRHVDCGESLLFIFDLRIQWHIFSVYINVFSTLNKKGRTEKHRRVGCLSTMSQHAAAGQGSPVTRLRGWGAKHQHNSVMINWLFSYAVKVVSK